MNQGQGQGQGHLKLSDVHATGPYRYFGSGLLFWTTM